MRLLLIKPSSYDERGRIKRFKKGYMPFLTLPLLKALTPKHVKVDIIDETIDEIDFDQKVDLVGITALTFNVKRGYEIASEFRKRGVTVVMGGFHVSALPDEALQYANSVVIGEAENIWEELIQDFEDKKLKFIYKSDRLCNLKKFLIPDYSSFNFDRYLKPFGSKGPFFPIQATRGCPFDCDFCSVTSFFGRTFRTKPIEFVIKEIRQTKTGYHFFVDDNIIGNIGYAKELFKALIPLNINWLGQFSTNIVKDPGLVKLAADSGCLAAYIGLESLSQENLNSVGKHFNRVEEYAELFNLLNKNGIRPFASIIFGFDNDDEDVFDRTVNFLIENKAGKAYFYILTPLPGTRFYKKIEKEGRFLTKDWNKYDGAHVVFEHPLMSPERLEEGLWRTYQRFFTVPRILVRNLRYSLKNPIMYPLLLFFDLHFRRTVYKKKQPLNEGGA